MRAASSKTGLIRQCRTVGCLFRHVDEQCGHGLRLNPRVYVARGPHLGTEPFELSPRYDAKRCSISTLPLSGGVAEQVHRTPQDMTGVVPIAVSEGEADAESVD